MESKPGRREDSFNCLIGIDYVEFSDGHTANLGAELISVMAVFPVGTSLSVASAPLYTIT